MPDYPRVPLGEVLSRTAEQVQIEPGRRYRQVTVRLFGKGVVQRDEVDGTEIAATTRDVVRPGQFIFSKIDARNGAFGLVPASLDGAVVTSDFPAFEVDGARLWPGYLEWLSKTAGFVERCRAVSEGSTNRVRLQEGRFLRVEVPLPPTEEQRRVAARLDALGGKVARAKALAAAQEEDTRELGVALSERLFEAVAETVAIEDFCDVRGGIQKSANRAPGQNPRRYLTVAHVQRNVIRTDDPRFFEVSDAELERWRLLPGDVLVIEGNGSATHIGRTALFRGEIEDCVHQNHVIRVRPDVSKVLPEYLNAYLNSPFGQGQMRAISRTSSGLFNLSVGRVNGLHVPLPSIVEQAEIVSEAAKLDGRLHRLLERHTEAKSELNALLASALARAFGAG